MDTPPETILEFLPCDDPSWAHNTPLPESHHEFGKWSKWRDIPGRDDHHEDDAVRQYRERKCIRCGQASQEQRIAE